MSPPPVRFTSGDAFATSLKRFFHLGALGELCGEMCGDDMGDILRGGTGGGSSRRAELGDMRGDPFTGECFACK